MLEGRYVSRVYVDDTNSAAAGSYALFNWRAGWQKQVDAWRLGAFVRVDNLLSREYVGSVIVNAANGAFYEPSPTRAWLAGVSVAFAFR
jgi:iron complex outermembrane receptor protein